MTRRAIAAEVVSRLAMPRGMSRRGLRLSAGGGTGILARRGTVATAR
jgi:hypothetical protein